MPWKGGSVLPFSLKCRQMNSDEQTLAGCYNLCSIHTSDSCLFVVSGALQALSNWGLVLMKSRDYSHANYTVSLLALYETVDSFGMNISYSK